jgi:hypothetical protein
VKEIIRERTNSDLKKLSHGLLYYSKRENKEYYSKDQIKVESQRMLNIINYNQEGHDLSDEVTNEEYLNMLRAAMEIEDMDEIGLFIYAM